MTEYTRKQAAEFRPTRDHKRQKMAIVGKHNENLRSVRKTKKYSAAYPLLKWSEKTLVT